MSRGDLVVRSLDVALAFNARVLPIIPSYKIAHTKRLAPPMAPSFTQLPIINFSGIWFAVSRLVALTEEHSHIVRLPCELPQILSSLLVPLGLLRPLRSLRLSLLSSSVGQNFNCTTFLALRMSLTLQENFSPGRVVRDRTQMEFRWSCGLPLWT